MSIVRGPLPRRNFTVLDNPTIEDDRLSFRALGILTYLLSKPEGWRVNASMLSMNENREGRQAVSSALRQLEAAGYIERRRYQNERGHWITESTVYDTPVHHHSPAPGDTSDTPDTPAEEDGSLSTEAKPQVAPKTGFRKSVPRESVSQSLIQKLESNTYPENSDIQPVENCISCDGSGWVFDEQTHAVSECALCDALRRRHTTSGVSVANGALGLLDRATTGSESKSARRSRSTFSRSEKIHPSTHTVDRGTKG
jgi:hypothetical protein